MISTISFLLGAQQSEFRKYTQCSLFYSWKWVDLLWKHEVLKKILENKRAQKDFRGISLSVEKIKLVVEEEGALTVFQLSVPGSQHLERGRQEDHKFEPSLGSLVTYQGKKELEVVHWKGQEFNSQYPE